MDTILWYWEISLDYIGEMLPCMAIGAVVFLGLLPRRRKYLRQRGLWSGPVRETVLFLFVLFCSGLAALTVFPANFWTVSHWQEALAGYQPLWTIPPLSQSIQYIQWTPTLFSGIELGEWGLYMLLANTLIFLPVGFFPNLLWRNPRWWKGLLTGFCVSFAVEFLQLFASRSTDIDDLILNSLGAFVGGLVPLILGKLMPNFIRKCQVEGYHGRETGNTKPAPRAGAG